MKNLILITILLSCHHLGARESVNEVTQLHPVDVDRVIKPHTVEEIASAVRTARGAVSIGGGRHSQGGQIAKENSLHLDMREFNKVVTFRPLERTITVQSGITWRDIQDYIDPANLSVSIMQSYSNFTVGGSLSVNCHGRYVGAGPLISSVKSIKVVLADGRVVEASPDRNSDIFNSAIGGYGGIGVIVEATFQLVENTRAKRHTKVMRLSKYKEFFFSEIRGVEGAVFHNADIYPPALTTVRAVTWSATTEAVTVRERLIPRDVNYRADVMQIGLAADFGAVKWLRQHVVDPINGLNRPVEWRNYVASLDVNELEPVSRKRNTYVLQEYFVPVERFDEFHPQMMKVLKRHRVNVINISIRHAKKDPGSKLAWARTEVFAFVLYYRQNTTKAAREAVGVWTKELIDAALSVNGTYYLPYQIWATPEQFRKAYPGSEEYFSIKRRVDPGNKFRNKLWDAYDPFRGKR